MQKKWIPVVLLVLAIACQFGCSSSLFKSFASNSASTQLESGNSLLDNAKTSADYKAAKEKLQAVIDDPNASAEDKKKAKFMYGEALLGENDITMVSVFTNIVKFGESGNTKNIMNVFPEGSASTIKTAADYMNDAKETGDKSKELTRGISNIVVAVNTLKTVMDVDNSGKATVKSGTTMRAAIDTIGTSGTGFNSYVSNGIDGVNNSGSLNTDQQKSTNKMKTAADTLVDLNTKIKSGTTSTYTSPKGTTYSVNSSTSDTTLNTILNDVFGNL